MRSRTIAFLITLAALSLMFEIRAAPATQPAELRPMFELRSGEKYFRIDGGPPAFALGRNPIGMNAEAFADHFKHMAAAGERFARIHFCYMPPGEKAGEIHPGMLKFWDDVLDAAERNKIGVLPVLGVWADWNDGSRNENWHTWHVNPFNAAVGGPAKSPAELFVDGSACQKLWLERLGRFVEHWKGRSSIVGWEIFSELDLVTGSIQKKGTAFGLKAAAQIRAADPAKRFVTVSLSGTTEWPELFKSDAVDLVEVHPYPGPAAHGNLDVAIIESVRERLKTYGKPVLIGECGLDAGPPRGTLDVAPRAEIAIRNAIWASVVSGAVAGRMLWWQDGYDQFEKADLCRQYQMAAAPAAAFVKGIDYAGFGPIDCRTSARLRGAVLGDPKRMTIGFFRDARCIAPAWAEEPVADEKLLFPVANGAWTVEWVDPATGKTIGQKLVDVADGSLRIDFPKFNGAIAFRATTQHGS